MALNINISKVNIIILTNVCRYLDQVNNYMYIPCWIEMHNECVQKASDMLSSWIKKTQPMLESWRKWRQKPSPSPKGHSISPWCKQCTTGSMAPLEMQSQSDWSPLWWCQTSALPWLGGHTSQLRSARAPRNTCWQTVGIISLLHQCQYQE